MADEIAACAADCMGPVCGDLVCDFGESGASCPSDCGTCGDGYCIAGTYETCGNCAGDCVCGTQTCTEVRACAAICAPADTFCRTACNAAGCAAAQSQTARIFGCGTSDACFVDCSSDGFVSPACMMCLSMYCADALLACVDSC